MEVIESSIEPFRLGSRIYIYILNLTMLNDRSFTNFILNGGVCDTGFGTLMHYFDAFFGIWNLIPRYLFVVVAEVFDVQTMRWWFRWWSNDPNGWNQEPKLPEPEDVFLLVRSKGSNQMTTSGAPSAAPSPRALEIYRRWMGWDDPHEGYQIDGFVFESGANTRNLLSEICRDSPVDFGIHPILGNFRKSLAHFFFTTAVRCSGRLCFWKFLFSVFQRGPTFRMSGAPEVRCLQGLWQVQPGRELRGRCWWAGHLKAESINTNGPTGTEFLAQTGMDWDPKSHQFCGSLVKRHSWLKLSGKTVVTK